MAAANTNIQLAELDFFEIKNNLKTYLQSQSTFTDYNFEGSGLSTLLDILAYNTHYNAYYLNMVANEMFLDTAVTRSSVVSHAKTLNYIPKSNICTKAKIGLTINNVTESELTLIKGTRFLSEPVDGKTYIFQTNDDYRSIANNTGSVTFSDLIIFEGKQISYSFLVNKSSNPTLTFKLPDQNIDTTTISIRVFETQQSTSYENYDIVSDYLLLDPNTKVYFLQESIDGYWEIYFGDGILGKSLDDGNVIRISYLTCNGALAEGANNFSMLDNDLYSTLGTIVSNYNNIITPKEAAIGGSDKESVESIRYSAPKAYAAQNRAVTKEDYSYLIKNNRGQFPIDSVSVWGGEELDPPEFGKVFIAIKPTGGYSLTQSQKDIIIKNIIKPISVITVQPEIVDVDYTYIKLDISAIYDKKRTTLTKTALETLIKNTVYNYATTNLNEFSSTFRLSDIIIQVKNSDSSIISNESIVTLQKKIYPQLNVKNTYVLNFNTEIKRDGYTKILQTYPPIQQSVSIHEHLVDVYFEEDASNTSGVDSIDVINAGYGYTSVPSVYIYGDGVGASAYAEISYGKVTNIVVDNQGSGYTQATAVISGGGGTDAKVVVNLFTSVANIVSYYYDDRLIKKIISNNVGTINFKTGVVVLSDVVVNSIRDNPLGMWTISVTPKSTLLKSTKNGIITIDQLDPNSISVNISE